MYYLIFTPQETYPHTAPIWFAESEDPGVSAAIERLCDTTADNYNVSDHLGNASGDSKQHLVEVSKSLALSSDMQL